MREVMGTQVDRIRALADVSRMRASDGDLGPLLAAVARAISESLAFRVVVINLYRPAWDDFEVVVVHGSDDARAALAGGTLTRESWERMLDPRFERNGAFLITDPDFEWPESDGVVWDPTIEPSDDPDAWQPEDALFVPMRGHAGELLGVVSVDAPDSGSPARRRRSRGPHRDGRPRGPGDRQRPGRRRGRPPPQRPRPPAPGLGRPAQPGGSRPAARRGLPRRPGGARLRPRRGLPRRARRRLAAAARPGGLGWLRRARRGPLAPCRGSAVRLALPRRGLPARLGRRGAAARLRRRALLLGAQRPRAQGVEPPLAARPAALGRRRADRLPVARRSARPPAAFALAPAGAAPVRRPGLERARVHPPHGDAALSGRARPADRAAQPPRPRSARRRRDRVERRARLAAAVRPRPLQAGQRLLRPRGGRPRPGPLRRPAARVRAADGHRGAAGRRGVRARAAGHRPARRLADRRAPAPALRDHVRRPRRPRPARLDRRGHVRPRRRRRRGTARRARTRRSTRPSGSAATARSPTTRRSSAGCSTITATAPPTSCWPP